MICMKCRSPHSEVVNTRSTRGGSQIWRRRRCANCGKVTTTYERLDLSFIQVASDSQTLPYSRSFLFASLLRAVPDGTLEVSQIDNLVDTLEQKILARGEDTVSTEVIRHLSLETLKPISMNAFMNYLAAHLQMQNKSDLKAALKGY